MITLTTAKTIDGIRVPKGTVISRDSATETQLLSAGEATEIIIDVPENPEIPDEGVAVLTYTWNTRPVYGATKPGTVINISDVGGESGSFWKATSAGWVPLNGTLYLANNWGTTAAPVATITNSTGALFSPLGGAGSRTLPAACLIPGHSRLRVSAWYQKRGGTASGLCRIYLGTTGTTADASIHSTSITADGMHHRAYSESGVVDSATLVTIPWLAPDGSSAAAVSIATTNINTNSAMIVSFGISTSNVADSFDLIGYSVLLESL